MSSTAALFHTAPSPSAEAASTMAYPVHDAEATCSHTGTLDDGSGEAITATVHGAAKAFPRILTTALGQVGPRRSMQPGHQGVAHPVPARPGDHGEAPWLEPAVVGHGGGRPQDLGQGRLVGRRAVT